MKICIPSRRKALSPEGKPEFATLLRVLEALGIRLHAVAKLS